MRKTKIVCTIGPASESVEVIKNLINAGMNVARINFSHGGMEEQINKVNNLKIARDELNVPVALLLDTKGPEIRTGKLENDTVTLVEGQKLILTSEDILGNENIISISYKDLCKEIYIGDKVLIDDGLVECIVKETNNKEIICEVLNGGTLGNRRGVNIPGLKTNLPSPTEKDIKDILDGIKEGFDYIAASFVRRKEDVLAIRDLLNENGGENIKIISKIENREGIDNFDEILDASDGIMVARGDLSVEIPMEEVPIYQKQFIKKCYQAGKMVITATQMLESMIKNPKPTRAEVSDIANAIFDISGGIMLSGESALGKYPVECVTIMDKIATTIEDSINYWKRFKNREMYDEPVSGNYEVKMNHSICSTAMEMDAKCIFAYTNTGDTPRMLSSFSPACPIYAVTSNMQTYRQLALSWGVIPLLLDEKENINEMIQEGIDKIKNEGKIISGDVVVIAGGASVIESSSKEINRVLGGVFKV